MNLRMNRSILFVKYVIECMKKRKKEDSTGGEISYLHSTFCHGGMIISRIIENTYRKKEACIEIMVIALCEGAY